MAGGPHDPAGRGDDPGRGAPLRPRRAAAPAGKSVLVSGFRRRHGDGLAFVRHHDQRHRRAQARADAAAEGARRPRLRRAREILPTDPERTHCDRGPGRLRRRQTRASQPSRGQGGQCRRAGWFRSLPARFRRHRRRSMGGGAAGHERRAQAGASLSLALGRADKLRGRSAHGDRRCRSRRDRQPCRSARGDIALRATRPALRWAWTGS